MKVVLTTHVVLFQHWELFPTYVVDEPRQECALGHVPVSALYSLIAFDQAVMALTVLAFFDRFCIPLYATIVIAARMPMTTITIRSSTIVNPDFFCFAHIDTISIPNKNDDLSSF
ncbi:hypothetical protein D3C87_1638400 [compost metagenome]